MDDSAIGIVLAGGRASRMAGAAPEGKAALRFTAAAETFLARICGTLQQELGRVVVVAAADRPLPPLPRGVTRIHDSAPDAGPLAAVRDGLVWAAAAVSPPRVAVLCSCDVPLVKPAVVRLLVARLGTAAWVVPRVAGHPQVLLSAMSLALLGPIEAYLSSGRRDPRGLLAAVSADDPARVRELDERDLAVVDPGLMSFRDVDTPQDLEQLRAEEIPPSAD